MVSSHTLVAGGGRLLPHFGNYRNGAAPALISPYLCHPPVETSEECKRRDMIDEKNNKDERKGERRYGEAWMKISLSCTARVHDLFVWSTSSIVNSQEQPRCSGDIDACLRQGLRGRPWLAGPISAIVILLYKIASCMPFC